MKSENLRRRTRVNIVFVFAIEFSNIAIEPYGRKIDRGLDQKIKNLPQRVYNESLRAKKFISKWSVPVLNQSPANDSVDFLANVPNREKLEKRFDKGML
ncbi:Oidioi.mRNA.OKI2018_I69.XSR.g15567.t1.cds [Oikopleura dioica]|uniref:Oidioi.mRNA.OKI2018_I69.XSR.g15567.t1.cds n=1 Tax=Oikopleura dioica TaxID=34765 RepID=A0ABN7SMH1_OIKDI|nr:Oidioi.mRNA.OKI2018_I69.XSR.g15567.t1.cds [Oikopleura dioica]